MDSGVVVACGGRGGSGGQESFYRPPGSFPHMGDMYRMGSVRLWYTRVAAGNCGEQGVSGRVCTHTNPLAPGTRHLIEER